MRTKLVIGLYLCLTLAAPGMLRADERGFCGCDVYHDGIIDFRDFAVVAMEWWSDDCWPSNDYCNLADVDHSNHVRFGDIDVIHDCWLTEDTTPPTPDPMQWDPNVDADDNDGRPVGVYIGPTQFDWAVTMRAHPDTEDISGVQFYFQCDDSGFDSGWITFPDGPPYEYTVLVGLPYQSLSFRVKARDDTNRHNSTGWTSYEPTFWP